MKMLKIVATVTLTGLAIFRTEAQGPPTNGYPPAVRSRGMQVNALQADSALHPPHKYALTQNTTDTTPQIFAWSTPSGDSLVLFVNGRYIIIGTGGGGSYSGTFPIRQAGTNFFLDSTTFRKQDSMYVVTDSTFIIKINGSATAFKMRGSLFSFNGRTGAITLGPSDVTNALTYTPYNATNPAGYITSNGLPNVTNNPQVVNALGAPSITEDVFANRPAAGIAGRIFISTDTKAINRDNGASWDVIGSGGSSSITAAQVGYGNVSNTLTSAPNFTYDSSARVLSVGDSIANHQTVIAMQRGGNTLYNKTRWFIGPQGNPEFNIGNLVYGAPYGPNGIHQSGDTSLMMIWHYMGLINGRTGWQVVGAGHDNAAGDQYTLWGKNAFGFNYLMSGRDIIGGTGYSNGEDWFDPSTSNREQTSGNRLTLRLSSTEANFTSVGLSDVKFSLPVFISIPSGNTVTDPAAIIGANGTAGQSTFSVFDVTHNHNPYALRILPNGNVGIGVTTPTAFLHLAAGQSTAGYAPLKFTSGAPTTTPEVGSMHYNNGLWIVDSSNSKRDTVCTRDWARLNIAPSTIPALTTTQVGFGDASSLLTSSARLTWDNANRQLIVGDTFANAQTTIGFKRGGSSLYNKMTWFIGPQGQPEFNIGNLVYSAGVHQTSDSGNATLWKYIGMAREGQQGFGAGHANSAGDLYSLYGKNMFGHNYTFGTGGSSREIIGATSYDNGADWFDPSTSNIEQTTGNRLTLRVSSTEALFSGTGISDTKFGMPFFVGIPGSNTVTDPISFFGTHTTGSLLAVFNTTTDSRPYSFRIANNGHAAFGLTTPTALVHISAGSATAGTAPLKFTSGPPTTTPEAGSIHYSNGLWIADSSNSKRDTIATRDQVRKILSAAGLAGQPFTDASALFFNSSDATKLAKLDLSGLTTATTRTYDLPDFNGTFAMTNHAQSWTQPQDMTGATLTVANQSANNNSTAAANTAYVDALHAVSGTYTPSVTNNTNGTGISLYSATWKRTGNIVTVRVSLQVAASSSSAPVAVDFDLPFTTATGSQVYVATGGAYQSGGGAVASGSVTSTTKGTLQFFASNTSTYNVTIILDYTL